MDGEVHAPDPLCRDGTFLAVNGQIRRAALVGFREAGRLDEQATGTARRVEDAARVRLEHLDEQASHRLRCVERAGIGALLTGEVLDEVLVGPPAQIARVLPAAESDSADHTDQLV